MSTRRPKSVLDQDRYTAELSTGQLVIGVCILLMFGLGCFLLGVLIGKFDPTLKNRTAQVADADAPGALAPEVKVIETARPATPPAAVAQPEQPPELRAPARMLANEPAAAKPATAGPAPSSTPPPTAESSSPPAIQAPAPAAESGTTPTAPPPAPAPAAPVGETVQAEAARHRVAPVNAQPKAVAPKAAATTVRDKKAPASAPAKPGAAALPAAKAETLAVNGEGWKGFGVQVAAVSRDHADATLKSLEGKTGRKGRILAGRNNLSRVVVGPFPDRAAANTAREDLEKRGYKGAYILILK